MSIPATMFHDAGAYAQCGDCGRYTMDPTSLGDRPPICECGSKTGWCGSFKSPGDGAKWSTMAAGHEPANVNSTAQPAA